MMLWSGRFGNGGVVSTKSPRHCGHFAVLLVVLLLVVEPGPLLVPENGAGRTKPLANHGVAVVGHRTVEYITTQGAAY